MKYMSDFSRHPVKEAKKQAFSPLDKEIVDNLS
jgi:hypothetical protein